MFQAFPLQPSGILVHVEQLVLPAALHLPRGHNSQLVSSLETDVRDDTNVPTGHGEQESASANPNADKVAQELKDNMTCKTSIQIHVCTYTSNTYTLLLDDSARMIKEQRLNSTLVGKK